MPSRFAFQYVQFEFEFYTVRLTNKGGVISGELKEQAYESLCQMVGEALYRVLIEGQPVSKYSIAAMIMLGSRNKPDLIEDIALDMLKE